jgi:hypothetical protein
MYGVITEDNNIERVAITRNGAGDVTVIVGEYVRIVEDAI